MKNSEISHNHKKEFRDLTENLSSAIEKMSNPVEIAAMLYTIAEEKKSSNLVVREINGKFESMMEKLDKISNLLTELNMKLTEEKTTIGMDNLMEELLSERDEEIMNFVNEKGRVCADDLKKIFGYRGRNAASARLSKLFKEGLLEKIYVGRTVYYKLKSQHS